MAAQKRTRSFVRAAALASAVALALAAPTAAFAVGATGTGEATNESTPTSTITGTIHATTLKATVPTTVVFDIDPGATQSTTVANWPTNAKIGQFTNPTNYTITNYSAVDVYGYVSAVTTEKATLVSSKGNLDKKAGDTTKANTKVLVALLDPTESIDIDGTSGWLAEGSSQTYYAFNKTNRGKLAASTDAPTVAGGSATMTIRGAVKNGNWAEGDSFMVKPVFKIVAEQPE